MKWTVNFTFEADTDNEELATQALAKALTLEFNQLITNLTIKQEGEESNGHIQTRE